MKTVIITGGNSGLGYACAQELVRNRDWYVVLGCRNSAKGDRAVTQIEATTNCDRIETMSLDLADLAAIR